MRWPTATQEDEGRDGVGDLRDDDCCADEGVEGLLLSALDWAYMQRQKGGEGTCRRNNVDNPDQQNKNPVQDQRENGDAERRVDL